MPNALAHVRSAYRRCIATSIFFFLPIGLASAASADIYLAAAYCANEASAAKLSEDGMIFCFDGPILANAPIDLIEKMNDRGFFVMRSPGGSGMTAMKMADVLMAKHATVIIRDYCLSACANYILVATSKTYVLKNSVVAWHGALHNSNCDTSPFLQDGPARFIGRCEDVLFQRTFFQKREIQYRYIFGPQTTYTRMMVNTAAKIRGRRSEIFWMWNPRNYGDHFKGRVVYEQYPVSQHEVDGIMTRFRLATPGQIVYDPNL